jgi:cellulose synthase operon protein B
MLLMAFAAGAFPAAAQEPQGVAKAMLRTVTLQELGLTKGIEFSGFTGYRELYFPAPRSGLEAAILRLHLRAGSALPGQRYLQIAVGRNILLSQAIGASSAGDTITLPIDPRLAEEGFLRVTLRYSGAVNADRCLDERVAGDFLSILPDTGLEMRLGSPALSDVRSVAALLPRDVHFLLPDRDLRRGEIAGLLRMAAVLRRRGATIALASRKDIPAATAGKWSQGLVLIGEPKEFSGQINAGGALTDGITVVATNGGPALLLSGEDAAITAPFLSSRWRVLADGATLSVNMLADTTAPTRNLSFEDLGFDLQSSELSERVQFDAIFSSDQLPRGAALDGIRLELAVGTASEKADATVFAFLNGRLLGSRRASGAVPTTLSLSVPEGLVGRDNTLSVRLQRPPRDGACVAPAPGQPVQLLPSSTLELSLGGDTPNEFFHLPQLFRGGVDVILPTDPAALREALTHFLSTAIDLLPNDGPITLRQEERPAAGDRPFIIVSREEPAEADPRLRFDKGALSISRQDGKLLLDLSGGEDTPTIAQVLRTPRTAGLWLRPGRAVPEQGAQAIRLDRGDIAVIDKAGIALAFSTAEKQAVNVVYHEIRSWTDLAGEYRPWIVGAIWLLLTALFVRALSLMYRRRSK